MSKQAFHGKITLNSATDLGSGSWEVNVAFFDALGVNTANGVQIGDVFIFNTGLSEQGTYTRFIVSAIGSINPFTGQAVFTVDYDTTQDNTNVANLTQAVGNTALATRPSPVYGLYPTPAIDIQSTGSEPMNDGFAEYVSNMNIKKIDAITGGTSGGASVTIGDTAPSAPADGDLWWDSTAGKLKIYYNDGASSQWVDASPSSSTNLSDYSTTNDMNAAIAAAIAAQDFSTFATDTDLQNYYTRAEVDSAISNVSAGAPDLTQSSIGDLSDVETSAAGHIPADGNALVWNAGHGHWMPGEVTTDLTGYATEQYVDGSVFSGDYNDLANAPVIPTVPTNVGAFTNDAGYLTSETADTVTTLVANGDNTLTYTAEDGTQTVIDLALYLDNVNLARITSGTLDSATGIATFTRDDTSTFDLDLSSLLTGITSYNDLADVPSTLVHTNTFNTFTDGNSFTGGMSVKNSDIVLEGVGEDTFAEDGTTVVPTTQRTITFASRTKDATTGIINPDANAYSVSGWFGQPDYSDNVMLYLNSDAGEYAAILADMTTGTTRIGSAGANAAGLTVSNNAITATGGAFTGDGSGLTNLDPNLARLDSDQSFTGNVSFDVPTIFNSGTASGAIHVRGVRDGTVDDQGADVTPTFMHMSFQQEKRDPVTKALDPNGGYETAGWVGFANYTEDFTLAATKGDGTSWGFLQANAATGDVYISSASSGRALIVGNGTITANVGHVFSGDGSGLINLQQGTNSDYRGALHGYTDPNFAVSYFGGGAGRSLIAEGSDNAAQKNGVLTILGKDAAGAASNLWDLVAVGAGSLVNAKDAVNIVAIGNNTLRESKTTGAATAIELETVERTLSTNLDDLLGTIQQRAVFSDHVFPVGGTGYTDGQYNVIRTARTKTGVYLGFGGTDMVVDVVTDGAGVVTSVTLVNGGRYYSVDEAAVIDGGDRNCLISVVSEDGTDTPDRTVAVGHNAGIGKRSGDGDVIIGQSTAQYAFNSKLNTYVGSYAGRFNDLGERNVFVGTNAGSGAYSANNNVAIGEYAGQIIKGDSNTIIGSNAGKQLVEGDNNIIIGRYAGDAGDYSNRIYLGSSSNTRLIVPGIYLDANKDTYQLGRAGDVAQSIRGTQIKMDGIGFDSDTFTKYSPMGSDTDTTMRNVVFNPDWGANGHWEAQEYTTDGLRLTDPENLVTTIGSHLLLGGPTSTMQHDLLAFGGHPSIKAAMFVERQRIDDDTWEQDVVDYDIFAQKTNVFYQAIEEDSSHTGFLSDGSPTTGGVALTHKAWRLTIPSENQLGYCYGSNILIGTTHIHMSCTSAVTVEYAYDAELTDWRVVHTSTGTYTSANRVQYKVPTFGAQYGVRITIAPHQRISNTNGYGTYDASYENTWPHLKLNSVKYMTHRPGNQGRGPEYQFPYDWDGDKVMKIENQLQLPNYRTSNPGYPALAFTTDQNTGIGKVQAGDDGIFGTIHNGVERVVFSNSADKAIQVYDDTNTLRKVWHAGNHGQGSGLVADQLDDLHKTSFMKVEDWQAQADGAYRVTPYTHIRDIPELMGAAEYNMVYSPLWGSEIGFVGSNAGIYDATTNPNGIIFTGVGTAPSLAAYDAWTSGQPNYATINSTNFPTPESRASIELPVISELWYSGKVGITFGNSSNNPDYLLVEVRRKDTQVWETVSGYYDNDTWTYGALDGSTGRIARGQLSFAINQFSNQGIDRIRYTVGRNTTASLRISHLFAYDYNANLTENIHLSKIGGEIKGNVTVSDSHRNEDVRLTIDGTKLQGTNNLYYDDATGVLSMSRTDDIGTLQGVFINDAPEDSGISSPVLQPSLVNDLAYRFERGVATITVDADIESAQSDPDYWKSRLFNGKGSFSTIDDTLLTDDGTPTGNPIDRVIEISWSGTDTPLGYGSKFGVHFHNTSFMPDYCKIEAFSQSGQTYEIVAEESDMISRGKTVIIGSNAVQDAAGITKVRVTVRAKAGDVRDVRIRKIFAVNYATQGPERMFMSRSGGELYGDVTIKQGAGFKQEWTYVNADMDILVNHKYMVDSGNGSIRVTLPTAASFGDEIAIVDMGGAASTANITVDRNGHNIMGTADDLVLNTDRAGITLIYTNATHGWVLKDN